MKWMILAACILILTAGLPSNAQESQAEVEGYVFKWETENIFPEGILFRLTLSRAVSDLRQVTLSITQPGLDPLIYPIALDEPFNQGALFTELAFAWPFPPEARPSVFVDDAIVFEWRAEDRLGETARVRDTFTIQDDRIIWEHSPDPLGFINLVLSTQGPDASAIRQSLMLPYNLLSANLGTVRSFNVVLYPADVDPTGCVETRDETTGQLQQAAVAPVAGLRLPCDRQHAYQLYEVSGYGVVQSDSNTIAGAQSALIRYLTTNFYQPLWDDVAVPAWFEEALILFYEPTSKARLLPLLRDAARVNGLKPLDEMTDPTQKDAIWQAQSYAMLLYIAERIGVEPVFNLARMISSQTFQAAYESAVGEPLNALLPGLRRWIFTSSASSAFEYTPYQPQTPTPTPSHTATRFPPTPTPTLTLTPTNTPTPTVTGVLSPTPSLTMTPSRTATARPPTVTPRPASSLWTPTPTPVPGLLDSPTNRLGVVTILVILLAIIGLILWWMERTRD
jgi:hypothetical protein